MIINVQGNFFLLTCIKLYCTQLLINEDTEIKSLIPIYCGGKTKNINHANFFFYVRNKIISIQVYKLKAEPW